MTIAILHQDPSLGRYTNELLRAWGLRSAGLVPADDLDQLRPETHAVVVCPRLPLTGDQTRRLEGYVEAGGRLITICPPRELALLGGIHVTGEERTGPLRLRVHGLVVRGLEGDALPIVGPAPRGDAVGGECLASVYIPNEFRGEDHESVAIASHTLGAGRLYTVLFDLPRSVMMLRQGDPALADRHFESPSISRRSCKPTNLATDIGPDDCGHLPFADLLARLLVDLVLEASDQPQPLLSTIPAGAAGVVLMSGDEDNAAITDIDEQMTQTRRLGGRMNLYIIPELTRTTPADASRYREHHDLGPHPNLVPLCGQPAEARVAEYERQLGRFESTFRVKPRSVRNHVAGWVGYLDLVAVQERVGIRMDANYFSGRIFRERNHAPFSPFGAALPMRFTEPGGRLYDVFQQHTQLNDDVWFAPDRPYSYKFSEAVAIPILRRLLADLHTRFRMPLTCNFHPGNWSFASGQAQSLMAMAQRRGFVCWSLDQWLTFWESRDACRVDASTWDGAVLRFTVEPSDSSPDLCIELPSQWRDRTLDSVWHGGRPLCYDTLEMYESDVVRLRVPAGPDGWAVEARYRHKEVPQCRDTMTHTPLPLIAADA